MKKTYKEFLKRVKTECKDNGVRILLRKGTSIQDGGIKIGGCFYEEPPTLSVAMGNPDFKSILAHEFCHMYQWLEQADVYLRGSESIFHLERWLSGERVWNIQKHISAVRDLELDNEIRTSRLIKKYDLGISYSEYIKKSNAYILFYNWLLESRRWSKPNNSPYKNKNIIEIMSSRFDMNYEKLDPEIRKIYLRERI